MLEIAELESLRTVSWKSSVLEIPLDQGSKYFFFMGANFDKKSPHHSVYGGYFGV